MQWSQLKKRLESMFAASVQGRVEIWATRYRHAQDQSGEAWITFDKKRLISMGTGTFEAEVAKLRDASGEQTNGATLPDPEAPDNELLPNDAANHALREQGIYPLWDVYAAFQSYLTLPIDDILVSDNPLIQSLGMLDRRFGMRRLKTFDPASKPDPVKKLYECRCLCEGIAPQARSRND